jgi:DNA-binding NtrC family response regulator
MPRRAPDDETLSLGISLWIPPLRDRRGEIRPLAGAFIRRAAIAGGLADAPVLAESAAKLLESYAWPGNVRELKNFMERAVLLSAGDPIEPHHLPVEKMRAQLLDAPPGRPDAPLKGEIDALERQRILDALEACDGNQTRAAKRLGIARGTLVARLEKYGLPRPKKRSVE